MLNMYEGGSKTIGPGNSKSYSSIGFPNFQRPSVVSPTPFNFPVFGRSLDAIMRDQKEPLPSMEIPYFLVVLAKDALKAKGMYDRIVCLVCNPNYSTAAGRHI